MNVEGKSVKSDMDKANLFGKILSETFIDNDHTNFDNSQCIFVESFVSSFDLNSDSGLNKVTLSELESVIKKLKMVTSPGEDKIHNVLLKNLPNNFAILLLKLINNSIVSGLPKSWKKAVITMIPKKEHKSANPSDYRPISLTSCLGKLTERIIRNRLYSYLENLKLIINQQSGFRNRRGTADNLIFLTQKISESFNRSNKVCGIFFDISKAFDKVWHLGLIYKLINLGVPKYIIKFVIDFLNNRFLKLI